MTEYFTTAAVWSVIGLILGYALGLGQRVGYKPSKLRREQLERLAGLGLVFIALLSTAQSLYFQRNQASITKCQAKYNHDFQETLQARSAIADDDRRNTVKMVLGVINAKSDRAARDALTEYIRTNERLEQERSASKFPDTGKTACKPEE